MACVVGGWSGVDEVSRVGGNRKVLWGIAKGGGWKGEGLSQSVLRDTWNLSLGAGLALWGESKGWY